MGSHFIDCMRQLHVGDLCVGIYKWAHILLIACGYYMQEIYALRFISRLSD